MPFTKYFEPFDIDGVTCQEGKDNCITVGVGRQKAEQVNGRIRRSDTPPEDAQAAARRILAAMRASGSSSAVGEPSSTTSQSKESQARAAAEMPVSFSSSPRPAMP